MCALNDRNEVTIRVSYDFFYGHVSTNTNTVVLRTTRCNRAAEGGEKRGNVE